MRAARTKVITAMVAPLGDGLADARDRTLLLFGFAGALRRSELVALDVEDVSEDDAGARSVTREMCRHRIDELLMSVSAEWLNWSPLRPT
jgi:integrase